MVLSVLFFSALFFGKQILGAGTTGKGVVPDSYIVVFKDNDSSPNEHASAMARKYGLSLEYTYTHALKGFSATIPAARLEQIKSDPDIKFVSQDRYVSLDAQALGKPTPTSVPQPDQVVPSGIRRIGQNTNTFGAGVGVAVIDTGIDLSHPDLAANIASENKTCVNRTTSGNDDNGHGTHVAGTIAALDNEIGVIGVAPQAKLYAVKVLDKRGSGTWSSVICGIDWVTAHASTIQVANMSLGGNGTSDKDCGNTDKDALHQAICKSTKQGITYVVAAGNEGDNAENHVPAAYDDTVITVSALSDRDGLPGADDTFASFSNYGDVVDLGAPGVSIHSTWKSGNYNTISGTSMATPHVSGAAALYVGTHIGSAWTTVRDELIRLGEPSGTGHTGSTLHPEKVVLTGAIGVSI